MKNNILARWQTGELNSEQAMAEIGERLKTATKVEAETLMVWSSSILDGDVPMDDLDHEADSRWWSAHHPTSAPE